jgi:hypothetical protein
MTEEEQSIRKKIDELSAQRVIAAQVLQWLESDRSFQELYGADSRNRHAAKERERIAQFEEQITRYKWALVKEPLVDIEELLALQKRAAEAVRRAGREFIPL